MGDNKEKVKRTGTFFAVYCVFVLIILGYMRIFSIYLFEGHNVKRTIGVSYMTMNNNFYQIIDDEIEKQVQNRGDKLITMDPALNADKQIEQIKYMINQKVDILILNPADWRKVKPGLELAKEAGIPVIIIDSEVFDTDLVSSTVVSDNYTAGVLCAEELMKDLEGGNVLILDHKQAKSALDRVNGFINTLARKNTFTIVDRIEAQGQTERSYAKVKEAFKEYKDINAIMSINDPTALGALAAIEEAAYGSNIYVYSVDASPDGKRLVDENLLRGTVAQYPRKMAQKAVELSYDLIEGKEVDRINILPVEMVNKETLNSYSIERWQ